MVVVVLGSNGMLGRYCKRYFSSIGITRKELDASVCTQNDIDRVLSAYKDDNLVVLNCMGIIKQRSVSRDEMMRVNGEFPHMVAEWCKNTNSKFLHVSTDCVYDGKRGKYTELDEKTATDDYGLSKIKGEDGNFTTIRTSIIGEEDENGLSLLQWVRNNKGREVNGYTNHYWNGITCLQFCKVVEQIINGNMWWTGVRHIHSPEIVTKDQMIRHINSIYNLNISITPLSTQPPIDRSLSSIHNLQHFNIPSLHQQITEQMEWGATKTLFLVCSIINTKNGVFSPEQRVEQTINTMNSIRKYCNDSYIAFIETSELDDVQKSSLLPLCDLFVDLSKNESCKRFMTNKSLGEASALYYGLKCILDVVETKLNSELNPKFNSKFHCIYKISGRYHLTPEFLPEKSSVGVTFREFSNDYTKWYSTVLYRVGWECREKYLDVLLKSIELLYCTYIPDIEHCMRELWSGEQVTLKSHMGVSGEISYGGEIAHH